MFDVFMQLLLFSAKALIIVVLILCLLVGILAIISRGKEKLSGRITIKNLNEKYNEITEDLLEHVLTKDQLKTHSKEKKRLEKERKKSESETEDTHNVFVLNFNGDIKASAVACLREEVTSILGIAHKTDEVVVRLESPGGMVHAYGLAASQLQRFRQHEIPLTIIVDKVAASGGYMMACIANKILAAPFAIVGSIGVIVQLPNFHRLLKEKNIDFEQLTAGNYKRTLTMFGQNTDEGREKLREEIEDIHNHFKTLIKEHRPQLDIDKVATGESWLGSEALQLQLIDGLQTSDDYLMQKSQEAHVYEIHYQTKKSLGEKLSATAQAFKNSLQQLY